MVPLQVCINASPSTLRLWLLHANSEICFSRSCSQGLSAQWTGPLFLMATRCPTIKHLKGPNMWALAMVWGWGMRLFGHAMELSRGRWGFVQQNGQRRQRSNFTWGVCTGAVTPWSVWMLLNVSIYSIYIYIYTIILSNNDGDIMGMVQPNNPI